MLLVLTCVYAFETNTTIKITNILIILRKFLITLYRPFLLILLLPVHCKPDFTPNIKINFKWTNELNIRAKMIKLEKIWVNLHDLRVFSVFLTPKAHKKIQKKKRNALVFTGKTKDLKIRWLIFHLWIWTLIHLIIMLHNIFFPSSKERGSVKLSFFSCINKIEIKILVNWCRGAYLD